MKAVRALVTNAFASPKVPIVLTSLALIVFIGINTVKYTASTTPVPSVPKDPDEVVNPNIRLPFCPKGISFTAAMSHVNLPPESERITVDLAAHREAAITVKASRTIPLRVHQIQVHDQVPVGMRDAMKSLQQTNPEFEFEYFSDRRAEEYFAQRGGTKGGKYQQAFIRLLPTRMRAEFQTAVYLWDHGGVHLGAGFAAVTGAKSALLKAIGKSDEFVGAVQADGTLSTEFIAAKKKHPIIGKWMRAILDNIENKKYGETSESVTGSAVLTKAFQEVMKSAPTAGTSYSKGVRVLEYYRRPECLVGTIRKDFETAYLRTRYPTYGQDTRWYRIHADDADAAWSKRHLFGDPSCHLGLTLDQESDPINEQPELNQVLREMAAHHPATAAVSAHQKIPRIILQTNKDDRIPKDLHAVMHKLIELNPEYEHYFYSDHRIRDFIKRHFENNEKNRNAFKHSILKSFDDIVPGAFKSDLFRYCFLYIKGGLFLDGDSMAERPLRELFRPEDEFVSAEDNGIGWVYNAFIAAVPEHPLVKRAIEMTIDRIARRDYGEHSLSISGPMLLRDAFEAHYGLKARPGPYPNNTRLLSYRRPGHCMIGMIEEDGRVVLCMRYPTYKSEVRWYMRGKSYYDAMWHERRIFVDGNPPLAPDVKKRLEDEAKAKAEKEKKK